METQQGVKPFNLDDELTTAGPQKPAFSLDDELDTEVKKPEQPSEGFGHVIDVAKGAIKSAQENTIDTIKALAFPASDVSRSVIVDKIKKNFQSTVEAAPIFGKDMLGFFDAISKKQLEKVINDANAAMGVDYEKSSVGDIAAVPFKMAGKALSPLAKFSTYPALASGVVDMLARPMELLVGTDFSQDNKPLTPEERALRAKHLLGDVVMLAATHTTAGAIEKGLAGEAISTVAKKGAENATTEELLKAAAGPKVGAISRRVISNSIGGGVGGFAGGLVSNSGKDDQLEAALINGVMGVPLGFAQEFAIAHVQNLRGKLLRTPEEISAVAKSIADERELKIYSDDSYQSAINKLESLKTSDNLSEAARKLGGEDTSPHIVDQIVYHQSKLKDLQTELNTARKIVADNDPNDPNTLVDNSMKPELEARIPKLEEAIKTKTKFLEQLKQDEALSESVIAQEWTPHPSAAGVDKYVISKNTREGEKPWRMSAFEDESKSTYPGGVRGHEEFDTLQEAQKFLSDMGATPKKTVIKPTAVAGKTFDLEEFKQNFYDEFNHYAYKTSNIMDSTPENDFNFDRALYDFAKQKGIGAEYVPSIRSDIIKRMMSDFVDTMEPDEKFAYNRMLHDLTRGQLKLADDFTNEAARVARKAAEQGMYINRDSQGNLRLSSRETGEAILSAEDSRTLMDDFAKDAGRPRADIKLNDISATGVPDEAIPKVEFTPTPISGNLDAAFSPRYGRLERLFDDINMSHSGSAFTSVKDVLSSWDNKHRTEFVSKIWDVTQTAYRRTVAKLIPYHTELKGLVNEGRSLTNEQWKQISEYRQSRTAKELVDRFTKTRGVSPLEQKQGQWFADNDINIQKIFGYRRRLTELEKQYEGPELENRKATLESDLGMSPKDLEAYGRFQVILSGSRNNSDLGAVVAYANALKSGMSKADYARKNNMNGIQLSIAKKLDAFYDKLANDFGIDDKRRLEDYMNHYRMYGEYPEIPALMDKTEQFLSEMPRTGEMASGDYEDHPIVAAMRYANAGVKTKDFYPTWNKAKANLVSELDKIKDPAVRKEAEFQVSDYLEGISGNRKFISESTLEHLSATLRSMGVTASPEKIKAVVRRWSSNYFATVESAAQGFRPSQGIRDFYGTMNNYYIRFGAKRANRALLLFGKMSKEEIENLGMRGEIGTLQPYEVVVPGEQSAEWRGALARKAEALADISFKTSMQKMAYRNGHAMAYNEAYINTNENLSKLAAGEITKEQAYKNMDLHTYDPGIQIQFDKLVSNGLLKEANSFLARMTAAETVFLYGAANQARFMTGLPGALAGQFGVWPIWESRFLTRMMSRGTVKQRLAAGTRYMMSQAAVRAADGLTGFNLSSWFLTPAAVLARQGPVIQAIYNTSDAVSANGRQQKTAVNALENESLLLVPGSQAVKGWLQAYDLWSRGFDPGTVAGRVAGIGVDESNQNWWDVLMRDTIGLEQNNQTIPSQLFGNVTQKKESPAGRKATNQQ